MNVRIQFNKSIIEDILAIFLALIFILLGLLTKQIFIAFAMLILIVWISLKNHNIMFSILSLLFIFHGTYLVDNLAFEWTSLYYMISVYIIVLVIIHKILHGKIGNVLADPYFYLMAIILCWGIISAIYSTQIIQSTKNILSVFLVFLVFYILPHYFYSYEEQIKHFKHLLVPINIAATFICILNLLVFFNKIVIHNSTINWSYKSAIYKNPNGFGSIIMVILMMMNIYIVINKEYKVREKENIFIKVYFIFSYLLLTINLLISSSRASLLGVAISFLPMLYRERKKALVIGVPISCFLWKNSNRFLLARKIKKGTLSGRFEIWIYTIKEVIAEHTLLGVGSGASLDYIGIFGGKSAHNSYLNVILSIGLTGFIFWMLILLLIFYKAFKIKNKYFYLFSIIGFMAFAFFETSLFGGMGLKMAFFWTIVMLIENQINEKLANINL